MLLLVLLGAARDVPRHRAGRRPLEPRRTRRSRFDDELLAQRGSLLAADGTDLATDRLAVDVTASPDLVTDPAAWPTRLAPDPRARPQRRWPTPSPSRAVYAVLARDVPPRAADRARALGIAGHLLLRHVPALPAGRTAWRPRCIGLTGDEHEGLSGMEKQLDADADRDARAPGGGARRLRPADPGAAPTARPVPGQDVR